MLDCTVITSVDTTPPSPSPIEVHTLYRAVSALVTPGHLDTTHFLLCLYSLMDKWGMGYIN